MNEQAKAILDANVLGVLATVNEDGSPWATPLHFVADESNLYWFSAPDRTHSVNVARDSRASVSLFSPNTSEGLKAVYVSGRVEQLGDEERDAIYALLEQRLAFVPPTFKEWSAYKLPIGTVNEQKSTGNCWYFYTQKT